MRTFKQFVDHLVEKNVPTSPEKWARAKAAAKSKFAVYPSAYANGWASKKYKSMGGGWKSVSENHVAIAMGKELDDEGSMIMNQLDQMERSINMMRDVVKDEDMQVPAWVQSKVTLAADYIETAAGYMSSKNEEVDLDEDKIKVGDLIVYNKNKTAETYGKVHKIETDHYIAHHTRTNTYHKLPKKGSELVKNEEVVTESKKKPADVFHRGPAPNEIYVMKQIEKEKLEKEKLKKQKLKKEEVEYLFDVIEEMVETAAKEYNIDVELLWERLELVSDEELIEESAAWQRKAGKDPKGGLNRKGIASYRRENPGSKLSMAVTTPPSKLKPGSKAANRRKSFCARMGGMQGAMKKPNGEPTRKALALRKWNC
jgi:hypothetical protein